MEETQTPQQEAVLVLLHWLTDLSLQADHARSLSVRSFQDEQIGTLFGRLAEQAVLVRTHLLATRCTGMQQARFWEQRVGAGSGPWPETYLAHVEEIEALRLKITPIPPVYMIRLLGNAHDLFFDIMSLGHAILSRCYAEELYAEQLNRLFRAYDSVRDAIEGEQNEEYRDIHDTLDRYASSSRSPWETRWEHFAVLLQRA
jgi:hypothetical protein